MRIRSKPLIGLAGLAAITLGTVAWIGNSKRERVSPPFTGDHISYMADLGRDIKVAVRGSESVNVRGVSQSISSENYAHYTTFSKDYLLLLNPDRKVWADYSSDRATGEIAAVMFRFPLRAENNEVILLDQNRGYARGRLDNKTLSERASWIHQGIRYGHEGEQFTFK
jgi:hypothetical protein